MGLIAQKRSRNVPFGAYGDHEPNICIEIGAPAIRRRAEGSLYVLETAFTVQRAFCTSEGKGQPLLSPGGGNCTRCYKKY